MPITFYLQTYVLKKNGLYMYAKTCKTLLTYTNSSKSADLTTILLFQTSTDNYKYHVKNGVCSFMLDIFIDIRLD